MKIEFSVCHNNACEFKQKCFRNITHHLAHKDDIISNFRASPHQGFCYYFLPVDAFAIDENDPTLSGSL